LLSRGLAFFGKAIVILLICTLPLLLIWVGIKGLFTGKLYMWSRSQGGHMLYGNAAIVAAWFHIGSGVGGIGFIFHDDVKPVLKWLLWLTATVCLGVRIFFWIRGS
jgi:hypothetical protein